MASFVQRNYLSDKFYISKIQKGKKVHFDKSTKLQKFNMLMHKFTRRHAPLFRKYHQISQTKKLSEVCALSKSICGQSESCVFISGLVSSYHKTLPTDSNFLQVNFNL